MAIQAVFLIVLWFLVSSAAQKSCGEAQCKLLPVEKGVANTFQKLATEKGVRLVYFNLEIGNDSFNPLESKERFFAKRWIWAKTIREPMLFLPEDYGIYSLGLLKYQVRHINIDLEEQPPGCLARLNTSCQDNAVGKSLFGSVTKVTKQSSDNRLHQENFLCTAHVMNLPITGLSVQSYLDRKCEYQCCSVQNFTDITDPLVRCGIPLASSWFVAPFNAIHIILNFILCFYCPAIPLLLPDFLFNLQRECENENKEEQQIRSRQEIEDPENNRVLNSQHGNEIELESVGSEDWKTDEESNRVLHNQHVNEIELESVGSEDGQTDEENNRVLHSRHGNAFELVSVGSEESADKEGSCSLELNFPVRDDQETSDYEIPLDDASPITFCALVGNYAKELSHLKMNFNLKLIFLCFVAFPFFLYLKFAIIMFHKQEFYHEAYQKLDNCKTHLEFTFCSLGVIGGPKFSLWYWLMFLTSSVILFVILTFIRPKDLLYQSSDMASYSFRCKSVSLSHGILLNLSRQLELVYYFTYTMLRGCVNTLESFLITLTPSRTNLQLWESRRSRAFRTLRVIFSVLLGLLIVTALGTIFILTFLVVMGSIFFLSPLGTFVMFGLKKISEISMYFVTSGCCECNAYFAYFRVPLVSFLMSTSFVMFFQLVTLVLVVSVNFVLTTFLFTTMGLVLNAEFLTPYAAFILVVARNVYLCYLNLQSKYKEVKGLISKLWEEDAKELPWINCSSNGTIPKELFWFVCGNGKPDCQNQVLPLRTEICLMLRDMALILTFLFVSLFTVLMFKTVNDISVVVSTIFVFVSGVIPSLILQGFTKKKTFTGWNKIRIEKKIKKAVKEYIAVMEAESKTFSRTSSF